MQKIVKYFILALLVFPATSAVAVNGNKGPLLGLFSALGSTFSKRGREDDDPKKPDKPVIESMCKRDVQRQRTLAELIKAQRTVISDRGQSYAVRLQAVTEAGVLATEYHALMAP